MFVDEIGTWWPLSRFTISAMAGGVACSVVIEPKDGGKVVEIGPDGTEHSWGKVRKYDPYGLLSMDFHIPGPQIVIDDFSIVDVTFTPLADDRTKVELKQTNWEAFGEHANMLRGGYTIGWDAIFVEAYAAAAAAAK